MKRCIIVFSFLLCVDMAWGCTSAIISATRTLNGKPLLWKHRDTGEENNKIERIEATSTGMAYIALFNASDRDCQEAWMGYNEAGFAIMNTASYNLKDDEVKDNEMDKEGFLMTKALRCCRSVDDFENLLQTLPKPLGVEANFGVIDSKGNGAYFETNNYVYKKYDLKNAPNGVLIRTNYSHSGRVDEGYGYIRENNAIDLLAPYIKDKSVTPATFTEKLSRTYYHSLLKKDYTHSGNKWLVDQDFIPRKISTATCVIEGVSPDESPLLTTMWVGLGFPPCSELHPAWIWDGGIENGLRGILPDGHSPICDEAVKKKHEAFSIQRGSGSHYFNLQKLYNTKQTGYCQQMIPKNLATYKKAYQRLSAKRAELKKGL